ncbi:hypothetical protein MUK42_32778, partial [Musa troglodytarum]
APSLESGAGRGRRNLASAPFWNPKHIASALTTNPNMKMPSRILRDKVKMEVAKPWNAINWACCTVSVYHVASSERCILMVGAKIPYNTRY